MCNKEAINASLCTFDQYGAFIGRDDEAQFPLLNRAVHLSHPSDPITYIISRSGTYCVEAIAYTAHNFQAWVQFKNPYGKLPAYQLGKIQFSAFLSLVFTIAAITTTAGLFGFRSRSSIFSLQCTTLAWFLAMLSILSWIHLDQVNRHGYPNENQTLRVLAIFGVALRGPACFLFTYHALPHGRDTSRRRTQTISFLLAASFFVLIGAREAAVLQDWFRANRTTVLLWTLATCMTMFVYHILMISRIRCAANEKFELEKSGVGHYRNYSMVQSAITIITAAIFLFGLINLGFLISKANADDYGHDLLSRSWQASWFLIDEWQTVIQVADVVSVSWFT